jgi:hypothetical protein
MLRVTIELLPFGREDRKRHLGTVDIANDGRGTRERGDYKVRLSKFGRPFTEWRSGAVQGFPRLTLGPYDLLLRALIATVGDRQKRLVAELREEAETMDIACAAKD